MYWFYHHLYWYKFEAWFYVRRQKVYDWACKLKIFSFLKQKIANKESKVLEIDIDDLQSFFSTSRDSHLKHRVIINTARYIDLFGSVCDENMPKPSVNFREQDQTPFDILMEQRKFNIQQNLIH